MKTAILFDLDGTLLDTLGDLHTATNVVLQQFGYPQRTLEEVRQFVGNGARRLIELAVPAGQQAQVDEVLAAFLSSSPLPPLLFPIPYIRLFQNARIWCTEDSPPVF